MNAAAIAKVVRTLTELGRLEAVDAAVVQAAQSLAEAVDAQPDNASLWREYRAAEAALRSCGQGKNDDALARALAELSA